MKNFILFIVVLFTSFFSSTLLFAQEADRPVVVYFFYGDGCPHCEHEKVFLNKIKQKYPTLEVREYEVWYHAENLKLYRKIAASYGEKSGNVPATFIDFQSWIGYSQDKAFDMEKTIRECLKFGCLDPFAIADKSLQDTTKKKELTSKKNEQSSQTKIPFLGTIDTTKISLPLLTIILAGLDGFNPCAFFVLLMLLSLMAHAQSRTKMLIVGGVFVFFSGFIYFLFMAAWLNLFMMTSKIGFMTMVAGIVAMGIAIVNIKDYFCFKKGVSLTISEENKASLMTKMRKLIQTGSICSLLLGTIVLAFLANLYELLCTAGFPMVFTRALTLQHLSMSQYYLYLVFYNIVYVLPLLTIVLIFVFTLGSRKLTEEEGRVLKLLSGLMMLMLGGILFFRPQLLNNIVVSIGLIIGTLVFGALIVWLNKKKMSKKALIMFFVFLIGMPVLSANAKESKITIVTTLFPTYDFVKQIGQHRVNVSLLLPPGVEPHAFEPRPKDIVNINKADIFVYTGDYMEPWSKKIIQGLSNKELLVVDVSRGIALMTTDHDHGQKDEDHHEDIDHHHKHHDEDFDHHHGKDPHIWLDLENAQKMIDTLLEAFIKKDPLNKEFYVNNALAYQAKLKSLDERFMRTLATAKHKTILYGGHFAFGYFAKRYGLHHESPYNGFSPNAEPSPKAVIELINKLKASGMRYIFHEELIDPKVARIIAKETNTTLEVLHAAHNVSKDELKQGVSFLSLMEHNLKKLIIGLECREWND